jgi:translocation and assembly module TamA
MIMKNPGYLLIAISLLGFCSNSWAYLSLTNHFAGISGDLEINAQTRLKLKQPENKLLTRDIIKRLNAKAPKEISRALQPYGYFKSQVTSKLSHLGKNWQAFYYVKLGKPLLISDVDARITGDGSNDPKISNFFRSFPLKKGYILNTVKYKQIKQDFLDLAATQGYILAKIEKSEIRIDTAKNIASITFYCHSGPRYFFGPIMFHQNPLSNKLLKKFLTYQEGEYYSTDKVHESQDNLNNSSLFRKVIIDPQYLQAKNLKVPIDVLITPRKSQQYTFGVGYGTDTGIRGLLGFELYNFASNGQHINAIIKTSNDGISNMEGYLEAHYIIPGKNPITDQYDIGVGSNIKDLDFGKSTLIKGGFGYTTYIFNWQQIARLDVLHEWWHFSNRPWDQATMLLPNIMWLKKKVDDPINPISGYRINLLVQGTSKYLASDINFLQANLDTKLMYPIPKGPILVLRGNIGYTLISNEDLNQLPLSFWFATGGSTTIRGYGYEKIGPGKELAVGNIELQQKLFIDHFYVSLFYDVGNAANNVFNNDQSFYEHQSLGFGFNYLSPIGSIRLTYARKIDESGAPGIIQFSIGPEL